MEEHAEVEARSCSMRGNKYGSYSAAGTAGCSIDETNDTDAVYSNPVGAIKASLDSFLS